MLFVRLLRAAPTALALTFFLPGSAAAQEARSLYRVDLANVGSCYDADLARMLEAHAYAYLEPGTLDVLIPNPPEGIMKRERITFIGDARADFSAPGSQYLISQVLGRDILLAFDSVLRDASGRLACYAYLPEDGTCVNLKMIREGWARVDRDSFPFHFLEEFSMNEQQAKDRKTGIWR